MNGVLRGLALCLLLHHIEGVCRAPSLPVKPPDVAEAASRRILDAYAEVSVLGIRRAALRGWFAPPAASDDGQRPVRRPRPARRTRPPRRREEPVAAIEQAELSPALGEQVQRHAQPHGHETHNENEES